MGLSAAVANLEWAEGIVPAVPVPPALQAEVRKAIGAAPGWLPRLAPSPWPARAPEVTAVGAVAKGYPTRLGTLLVLPPEPLEAFVASPVFRFVRPLLAWRRRPGPQAPAPAPRPNDGPCAAVVAALDGSPAAGVLRRAIDGAWASDVLPRRTKTLMLAVIARALGCAHGEQEARRFLAAEGLPPAELDDIPANPGSPPPDAPEARPVALAR